MGTSKTDIFLGVSQTTYIFCFLDSAKSNFQINCTEYFLLFADDPTDPQ